MAAPNGTVWGSIAGGYGRIGIYKAVSTTNTTVSVTASVWFWSKYSVSDTANTFYYGASAAGDGYENKGSVNISTTVASGSGWSTSNQVKLDQYTHSFSRSGSASTQYLSARLINVDRVGAEMKVSTSISIPALPKYTVYYSGNGSGVTNIPANQTKTYGVTLSLDATRPERTGYSFLGWSTSSTATSATYLPGALYTTNASITLYAVWQAYTYVIKYNANGGSGAPADQKKTYGQDLKLSMTTPTRNLYTFLGWSTSSTASTATYTAGGIYKTNAPATLYAVWELAYIAPRIFSLKATRSESDPESVTISFNWECFLEVTRIHIVYKPSGGSATTYDFSGVSGTSGTSSYTPVSGSIPSEVSATITVTVTDSNGSTSASTIAESMLYPIDVRSGGKGVAFGKTAELDDVADFGFDAKFNGPVYGNALGMNKLPQIPSNSDLNDYMSTGCYAIYRNSEAETIDNIPIARAGRLEVWSATGEGIRSQQWSYIRQRYIAYNKENAVWERDITRSESNVWTFYDWVRTSLNVEASNFVYNAPQKLLWSGGKYMTADHTASLSEAVSAQRSGIVLVFSKIDTSTGTSLDNNYNSFFIAKRFIAEMPGRGNAFTMMDINFGMVCHKYLYINDTTISGHANNGATGTGASGITYANNKYILRKVYGV